MNATTRIFTVIAAAAMLFGTTAGKAAADAKTDCQNRAPQNQCQAMPNSTYTTPCDCRGADLSSKDLTGKNLKNIKFNGASTKLEKTILKSADLSSADFTDASLYGADLSNAIVVGWIITNTDFKCAKWVNGTKWCSKQSTRGTCIQVDKKPGGC